MNGDRNIKDIISKAEEKYRAAELLLNGNCYDDSVSRSYYAVFHAITAVLFKDGLTYSSHSQSIGAFNKNFINKGIFPKDFSGMITELFEFRQTGDYNIHSGIDRDLAIEILHNSKIIISAIADYLHDKGLL